MDLTWMRKAACKGLDPAIFYPEIGGNEMADQAKAICAKCPVKTDCLEYALANYEHDGIWGGTSEKERRSLRRARRRAKRGSTSS